MFSRQELTYLAMAARIAASNAEKDADAQSSLPMKSAHATAAKGYRDLAEKCERLKDSAPRSD